MKAFTITYDRTSIEPDTSKGRNAQRLIVSTYLRWAGETMISDVGTNYLWDIIILMRLGYIGPSAKRGDSKWNIRERAKTQQIWNTVSTCLAGGADVTIISGVRTNYLWDIIILMRLGYIGQAPSEAPANETSANAQRLIVSTCLAAGKSYNNIRCENELSLRYYPLFWWFLTNSHVFVIRFETRIFNQNIFRSKRILTWQNFTFQTASWKQANLLEIA